MHLHLILSPPILKQVKQTTRDDRIRIQALYDHAYLIIDQISLQLNFTPRQVQYALYYPRTPQKKTYGRKPFINTPRRKFLID